MEQAVTEVDLQIRPLGKDAVDMNKPVEGTQANQAVADKPDTAPKQES